MNDDCLSSIFCQLNLWERLKLEKVCRRWRAIMPYGDIHVLEFDCVIWRRKCFSSEGLVIDYWLMNALHQVLPRCGQFLKEFCAGKELFLTPHIFQYIISFCPNLTKFSSGSCGLKLHIDCLPALSNFECLKCLELNEVTLLSQNGRPISIFQEVQINFENLIVAHPSIDELKLSGDDLSYLPRQRNHKLKKLDVDTQFPVGEYLPAVAECYPNLISLCLYSRNGINDFQFVASFRHLKTLCLFNPGRFFSDQNLELICRKCPNISYLHMVGLSQNQVKHFAPLQLLENLTHLEIETASHFNDSHLESIAQHGKIEKLYLNNSGITNWGLFILGDSCTNLTELSILRSAVGGSGLMAVVVNCKNLLHVVFSYNKNAKYCAFLKAIGMSAVKLRRLEISGDWSDIDKCRGFWELLEARESRILDENLPELIIYCSTGTPPYELKEKSKQSYKVDLF